MEEIKAGATGKQAPKEALGYPAPENGIVAGKFYQCEASIQETWPDRINNFLVLQEMVPNGKYWKIIPGQKRLFQVSRAVGHDGMVYLAQKTNGAVSLKPMDKLPLFELQMEKPAPQTPKAAPKAKHTLI
ncbi:MAG: hypothetical protein HYV67_02025 [Candidatus Taylorbacteria bacterium]|nr:hypothetical protein [Candidatus Taylorbacteria bacterium]